MGDLCQNEGSIQCRRNHRRAMRITSKPINDLDLIDTVYGWRETWIMVDVSMLQQYTRSSVRVPPWTQNIRSSITADNVKKSNMSVKYVQTWEEPYFRTHSV